MTLATPTDALAAFSLDDRYRKTEGPIYLTGVQALVRTILARARFDRMLGADHATLRLRVRGLAAGRLRPGAAAAPRPRSTSTRSPTSRR